MQLLSPVDPVDKKKERLLLVENHEAFAQLVTQQFLADYDVEVVKSVRGALAALKADTNYDYILVDYDLDDGKGDEVVRAASELAPSASVVGVSAHETGNQRLREAGAVATCAKRDFAQIGDILGRELIDHRLHDAVLGALLGCMVGDSLGSVFEGAAQSPRLVEQVERRAAAPAYWRYTDDTEMAFGVAESLIACGGLDQDHLVRVLRDNCDPARGYGKGTRRVLSSAENWRAARYSMWRSGSRGNGAAARVVAIACAYAGRGPELNDAAVASALTTHAHEEAYIGAALVATVIAEAVQARQALRPRAVIERLHGVSIESPEYARRLEAADALLSQSASVSVIGAALGNGVLAVESVPSALCVALRNQESFEKMVVDAVALGGDTDTIGAMVGAVAGGLHGAGAIPLKWLAALEGGSRGRPLVENLARGLLSLRATLVGCERETGRKGAVLE